MKDIVFNFNSFEADSTSGSQIALNIPRGIDDKQTLFRLIAVQLRFPDYFGYNWDALDECLADLSWLEGIRVFICHQDIPLSSKPDEARKYLRLLDTMLREPGDVELRVHFPSAVRNDIQELLMS